MMMAWVQTQKTRSNGNGPERMPPTKSGVMTRSSMGPGAEQHPRNMNTQSNPDIPSCVADAMAELSRFLGLLHKRFGSQLPYDILTNLPKGIVQREMLAKHAVRVALVAALGEYLQWDAPEVTRFAGDLLEDGNLHYLAGILYELTDKPEADPFALA